jgi:hypothetical protein
MKIRTIILAVGVALVLAVPAAQAAVLDEGGGAAVVPAAIGDAHDRTSTVAGSDAYVPFVSDFPVTTHPVSSPSSTLVADGLDWSDVSVGVGMGVAFAALLVGSALALVRRGRGGAREASLA